MPTVKLFAGLRMAAGIQETHLAGDTLRALLTRLVEEFPALRQALFDGDALRSHGVITLNGHPTLDLNASLNESDEVAIFPPMAGGDSLFPLLSLRVIPGDIHEWLEWNNSRGRPDHSYQQDLSAG